jgi:uncharacterized membrane protein
MARRIPELFGVLGSVLLLAGVFAPVLQPPHGPALSYRQCAPMDGNVVIGLAAVSFVLTWVFHWYRALGITAAVAVVMLAMTWLKVPRLEDLTQARLTWGCLLLGGGILSLFIAALLAERERRREDGAPKMDVEEDGEPNDDSRVSP